MATDSLSAAREANAVTSYYGSDEIAKTRYITTQTQSYPRHKEQLRLFLSSFESNATRDPQHGQKKYLSQLQHIVNRKSTTLKVSIGDCIQFFQDANYFPDADHVSQKLDPTLPECLVTNSMRYIQLLYEAAEDVRRTLTMGAAEEDEGAFAEGVQQTDDADLIISEFERGLGRLDVMERAKVPIHLRVPYEIRLVPVPTIELLSVREVRSKHVGHLVRMEALVTKVSTVKPRLSIAFYRCQECGCEAHQSIDGPSFMPLLFCESNACKNNKKKGELRIDLIESKFIKYQEVKVQEPAERCPPGSIPTSQRLVLEGSLTRKLLPGMSVILAGVLLPVQRSGYQGHRSFLITETKFHVQDIIVEKRGYEEKDCDLSLEEVLDSKGVVDEYADDPALYEKMARSIAPSIHGLEDVKKILLLQLVGGVTERFQDGMRLRGDIHVLLMGDPGVAKSQLLGQVCRIAPRAHYTTGKGSSGVGLTAAVVRDPITGDFTLEGGAIVLADKGVCCIDEFDKMDEYDRTAIHEVMEQQTVSISKAGLTTTLNARTSVLAAANPQYGRYDVKKTPMQNINLPAALLSRFDIQYLLLDKADREADSKLAHHVLRVHQASASVNRLHPVSVRATEGAAEAVARNIDGEEILSTRTVRLLIAKARKYNPRVPESLTQEVVEFYVDLRQTERGDRQAETESTTYTTPRTLLAILRLAQARARLRFSNVVNRGDFEEGLRLIRMSKHSVVEEREQQPKRVDYQTDILDIMKDMDHRYSRRTDWDGWIPLLEAETQVSRMGFTKKQLLKTIEAYIELDVLQWRSETSRDVGFTARMTEL